MTNAINFTKSAIDNLATPLPGKRVYHKDSQMKGLSLAIQPSGMKSFYVIKKIAGRSEKIFLGKYPDLSIENARKMASVKLGQIANGINPQEQKRTIRAEMTFGQLVEQYISRYSKLHKKTWKADQDDLSRFTGKWVHRKLSDIKPAEIRRLIETIYAENGRYQANKILQRIRAVLNKAIEWGWQGSNSTVGIKKYPEKSRDRFIQPYEMPWFIKALEEEPDETIRDFLWCLLLLGARKTNTLMMRWDEINWERQEWRIPNTKNGEVVTIPLTKKAFELLQKRRSTSVSQWVFPQRKNAKRHLTRYRPQWIRLLQKASLYAWATDPVLSSLVTSDELNVGGAKEVGDLFAGIMVQAEAGNIKLPTALMDLHIHDLRRTFGSFQALTGASLQIIGKSLGHKSLQATQIYARLNLDPVRLAMQKATNAMLEISS